MENKVITKSNFIDFKIGKEIFAVNVRNVLEITRPQRITRVPKASDYILGIFNFRGSIVPVIDMFKRFNIENEDTSKNMVIVVDIEHEGDHVTVGMYVDEVTDIIEISDGDIRPIPDVGIKYNSEFIMGMVEKGDDLVILINPDRVMDGEELVELEELTEEPEKAEKSEKSEK